MLRRCRILLLLTLCLAGCQKPVTLPTPTAPSGNLTLANFEKIQLGMTLQEVEVFLGPHGARISTDVKRPDGSVDSDVHSVSWFWSRLVAGPGEHVAREVDTRRIVLRLKDGKITSKEQVGLK